MGPKPVPTPIRVNPTPVKKDATTPPPSGKRRREGSLNIDPRSTKKPNNETQFLSTHQDLSGHAHAKDTSHATEDIYIREELQNLPYRDVPYEAFLDVVLEGWRRNTEGAASRAAASQEFQAAKKRYEIAVAKNKEKHTAVTEKALYSPFCDMVNAIMVMERFPYKYVDTHDKKVPNLEKLKHDPDRRPDGILVSGKVEQENITWAYVHLMYEFKAHSSNDSHETSKSRKTANASSSSRPKSHRTDSGDRPQPKKITLTAQEQLACYAMEVMSSTGAKRHCLGIYIDNDEMQVWYFDRSGPIGSASVPFGDNYCTLATLVSALGQASESQLGYEPFVYRDSLLAFPSAIKFGKAPELPIVNLFKRNLGRYLIGPGTSVWDTRFPNITANAPNAIIKLSWADPDREPEDTLIEHARKQGVRGIPTVRVATDLAQLSEGSRGKLLPLLGVGRDVDDRVLRLLVLQPNCIPLQDVTDLHEFMKAFISLVTTHYQLYSKSNILHRNVALNNLLYDSDSRQGILIDYQQAIRTDQPRRSHRSQYRVPTTPFLAIDLCESETPSHLYRHDLESFYWILWWIGMKYGSKGHVNNQYGSDWYFGTYQKIHVAKRGHIEYSKGIKLTPRFKKLRRCLLELSDLFGEAYQKIEEEQVLDNETVDGIVTYRKFVGILSSWNK